MTEPDALSSMLANAHAMATEDRATIAALQDIVAKQAIEIMQLRADKVALDATVRRHLPANNG